MLFLDFSEKNQGAFLCHGIFFTVHRPGYRVFSQFTIFKSLLIFRPLIYHFYVIVMFNETKQSLSSPQKERSL